MKTAIEYFKEIMTIPRPSGNEEKIADYLCEYAKEHGYEWFRDEIHNVIIKKDNGSKNTIILQGHTDMVCVADKGVVKNFFEEGIDWFEEDDYIKAKGTTLGADNGIGVAIILAILEESGEGYPNIEAVFTVQEETTMAGARALDYSKLSGKHLLSLDGDREGVLEVSSAGISDIELTKKLKQMKQKQNTGVYVVEVSNLIGGHSGDDINKNRFNAIEILGKILKEINPVGIVSIYGGEKSNVIPSYAIAEFVSEKSQAEISFVCSKYRNLAEENDNHPTVFSSKLEDRDWVIYDEDELIDFVVDFKHGVINSNDSGFPITSENLGAIRLTNGEVKVKLSIRSSVENEEIEQTERVKELAKKYRLGFELKCKNPFFSYKENSKLRDSLKFSYNKLYGKEAFERHIHAGLEGGVFAENINDIDVCVIAVDIFDLHSIKERVSVSSIQRVYDWTKETLQNFSKKLLD